MGYLKHLKISQDSDLNRGKPQGQKLFAPTLGIICNM